MRLVFAACLTTLLFNSCGGEAFTASGGAVGESGGAGGSGGHSGSIGVAGENGGNGGSGAGGGNAGSSTGGQPGTGGAGGVVATDAGTARDATAGGSGAGGSVVIDAGSPCGLALNYASHTSGLNQVQLSVAHTVSGLNRLLIVALAVRHDPGTGMQNMIPPTLAVTFGSAALTRLKSVTDTYYQSAELWTLVGPPSMANQVIVKFASAPQHAALGVMSFTGAAPDATFGAASAIATVGSTATISVSSAGYAAVVDLLSHGGVQLWNTTAGTQELWRDGTTGVHGYSSFTRVTGSMTARSWTGSASANYALVGVPIAEVRCPGSPF